MEKNIDLNLLDAGMRRHEDRAAEKSSIMKPRLVRELSLTPLLAAMLAACGGGGSGGGGYNLTPNGGGGGPRSYELMRAPAPQTGNGAPQAGNQGIAGDEAGSGGTNGTDGYEPRNPGSPGGTYSGSNSDDAGDTYSSPGYVPPIPNLTMDEPDGDKAPVSPPPDQEPSDAGKSVGSPAANNGQAGNNGQIAGQASPQDAIEPANAPDNSGDGASSGSNSNDAGDTIPPQTNVPPIPNSTMD